MAPRIHMRGRPLQQQWLQGAPGSHTRDTASGTSPTWPPALNSMVCTLYNMLDKDFYSCTLNQEHPFEKPNTMGLAGTVPQGASTTQHFGLFVSRCN